MKRSIFLSFVLILSACGMPETRIYSVNMPAPAAPPASKALSDESVAISITSPRYLSQPYMAHRSSPYQLLISRYAKWDAAPEEIVRDAIKESVVTTGLFKNVRTSSVVPGGFYSVKVNLKRFERLDEGKDSYGDLAFDIVLVSPDGKELYHASVVKKSKLEDKSWLSLAKGLSLALSEGMAQVKTEIRKSFR